MEEISKLDKFYIANPMNNGSHLDFGDVKITLMGETLEINIKGEYRYLGIKEIGELSDFLVDCKTSLKKDVAPPKEKQTKVVNVATDTHDVYIGRKIAEFHYGNPFTHKYSGIAKVTVSSRKEAVLSFRKWIKGQAHHDIEPERRQWILDNLHHLKGKTLGCYCKPKLCHGDIYVELLHPEFIGYY